MKKEVIICFALAFVFVLSMGFAYAGEFTGYGEGTSDSPYQIANCGHLQQMRDSLNAYFKLINDIDCSETKIWSSNKGFIPIGSNTSSFKGTLIGNSKSINFLYINRPNENYVGLFGNISSGANISKVGLTDSNITGNFSVGLFSYIGSGAIIDSVTVFNSTFKGRNLVAGIAGYNFGRIYNSVSMANITATHEYSGGFVGLNRQTGIIDNSIFSGKVNGGNYYTGGFAGRNYQGAIISNSYSIADVTANDYVGGFVGMNSLGGKISSSKALASTFFGKVIGRNMVGGFAGANVDTNSEISESFSVVDVSYNKGNYIGGFVGQHLQGNIWGSFSTGNVNGTNYVGGFVGYNNQTITDSYSNGNANGTTNVGGFAGHNIRTIKNSYSSGKIKGATKVGGFVGLNTSATEIYTNNFWDIDAAGFPYKDSGDSNLNGVSAKDTPIMKLNVTYTEWDFANIWAINEGASYPCAYWVMNDSTCPLPPPIPPCVWIPRNSTCINDTSLIYYIKDTSVGVCTGGNAPENATNYCDSNRNGVIGEYCSLNLDSVFIEGEYLNASRNYTNSTVPKDIDLVSGGSSVLFSWNFSRSALNVCPIEVESQGTNSSFGYAIIKNVGVSGKTVFFDRLSNNSTKVCIKDEAGINSIDELSDDCDETNEFLVPCPGNSSGYYCNISGSTFEVWPLNHSAIREILPLSANVSNNATNVTCANNWTCTDWSNCVSDSQTRTCTDLKSCNNTAGKPAETQACDDGICEESWDCTDWSECISKTKTRACTDSNACGTDTNKPGETEACTSEREINWLLIGIIGGGIIVVIVVVFIVIKMMSKKEEYVDEGATQAVQ